MLNPFFKIIALCWAVLFAERMLFWLYLWQLKEYHFGRLSAHFSTEQGKKILFNIQNLGLIILIAVGYLALPMVEKSPGFLWSDSLAEFFLWSSALTGFFVLLFLWVVYKALRRRIKLPKLTQKTFILILISLAVEALILWQAISLGAPGAYLLLVSYFVVPFIASIIVFAFQPLVAWQRNKILQKAQNKLEKIRKIRKKRDEDFTVVGISGSYGKTSTKEILATILSEKFTVLKTPKHINSEIGIAQTILRSLTDEHEVFVAEIGAYEKGKIKQVCNTIKPDIGILTGINQQHMATFGSQENIIKAKFELIGCLPQDGMAVFNGNNEQISNLKSQISNIRLKSKIFTEKITNTFSAIAQKVLVWEKENLAMAVKVAKEMGMTEQEIERAVKRIKSSWQIKEGINGLKIIDSAYSANPHSVMAHLDYLAQQFPEQKKVLIMPCLIELGRASKQAHQRIGEKIGRVCDLAIITTKERFKPLKQSASKAGMPEDKILFIKKPQEILEKIKSATSSGDAVLLEGRLPKILINQLCALEK